MNKILEVSGLSRVYETPRKTLTVLQDISFSVEKGTTLSIVGSSGSGKSTLLGLCAGLDLPTSGKVSIDGQWLDSMDEDQRAALRNEKVGFIFQDFQLIPTLTALENVMLPLELKGQSGASDRAKELLSRVGLGDRWDHYPNELSGGEQQRVSLARAFANEPQILFADEPTGNLDETTGASVEDLLFEMNREKNTTLIIVTHDLELSKKTDRVIRLKGGHIVQESSTTNA